MGAYHGERRVAVVRNWQICNQNGNLKGIQQSAQSRASETEWNGLMRLGYGNADGWIKYVRAEEKQYFLTKEEKKDEALD